ncbi:TM0106 family RecB-like putative nuclease [Antrihabitans cavernicola]|uniref:TM0106 family RecB-like putative nuclease n=1 Tax=Antrihabitans cavernicola TaxID=2495913 RepID=A0A5A7SB44_9NOCA|nr:bifunctional RecB family nuclease/DEAD/DEAH box helicase [Spelaeibacter cavernicola]KAA0022519.1 TM0106 family RecB-like putative nuclease [Spelaeibacter cavernicola]
MFLLDDRVIYSASDLAMAASCEFALLRTLDGKLDLTDRPRDRPDPMLDRTARLGDAHERRQLAKFTDRFGEGVRWMDRPGYSLTDLRAANQATVDAAVAGTDVIYQGTFFDGRFLGFCDFLVREGDGYAIYDTKLARHAKVASLLQLAAYADALAGNGIRPADRVHLLLGDHSDSTHLLADLEPVHSARRDRLQHILDEKQNELLPVQWSDLRYSACGRCDFCEPEVEASRDPLLVAGMRATARARLLDAGVTTIDLLATTTSTVAGVAERTFTALHRQAKMQLRQEKSDEHLHEVVDADLLGAIPAPDPGDIFFDFEGDPMWSEAGSPDWGLEYLFGVVEGPAEAPTFRPFWAHDRAEERQALIDFLAYVTERRKQFPNMHVYHYAAYEKTALLRLAGRYGVGEETVDNLLRQNVLVDLYPIVRAAVRIGRRSYSIKKLEPLYMGEQLRDGDVTDAAGSIVAYAEYCDLRDNERADDAAIALNGIADYNEYDCVSTLRLRDWLLSLAAESGVEPRPHTDATETDVEYTVTESTLREFVGDTPPAQRSADETAAALMASAIGYHRRERKPFWWAHFDRLTHPVDEWADTRDVLVAESGEVDEKWFKGPRQRKLRRVVTLTGKFGTGTTLRPGSDVYALYDQPAPDGMPSDGPAHRATTTAKIVSVATDDDFNDVVQIEELLATGVAEYDSLPMALTPASVVRTDRIDAAIETAAAQMCSTLPNLPNTAAVDILRRTPPRLRSGATLPAVDDLKYADAITRALLDLDNSYVAVQGPPGTGKTFTGAKVIRDLVLDHNWRVGVVAQSHSVIENALDRVVSAGVPGSVVAKKGDSSELWTSIKESEYAAFIEGSADTGCVIGGTAWDFAHDGRVPVGSLDLLVIDEAGQFALANTIAVAQSARNLLLLGDPQQLPQVSQGTHPEPVDMSALGWLAEGRGALPVDRGYFLEQTWRMHPSVCEAVSQLAYDGKLRSNESVTAARDLDGIEPGVDTVFVEHQGNSTESEEEAREVVRQIKGLLGTAWSAGIDQPTRPLAQTDILVVAPYNAQVALLRSRLSKAGLAQIPVGTVDKFQGREAAVVLVSMTASAIDDIPRGMTFLLSRNRLNVAISRALWKTVLIRSRLLTEYLPTTPDAMSQLGAFMRLCR